ncbi:MAG: YceI family protein [Halieaceae bacterium]|jgi:polyisoprenoid-binding protein YceI|nr:YceI family protein [Halieaceae bacterium]
MTTAINGLARVITLAALLTGATAAQAQWELDGAGSAVNFVSIKNDSVAELHRFASVQGSLGKDGKARLTISLDSVETLIPIRNERMREMLFETATFPTATASATVAPELVASLAGAGTMVTDLTFTLALHGVEKAFTVPVVITGAANGGFQLFTPAPVIVNAADFGLEAGVAALQSVAGLKAISAAVPVTVHLVFKPL